MVMRLSEVDGLSDVLAERQSNEACSASHICQPPSSDLMPCAVVASCSLILFSFSVRAEAVVAHIFLSTAPVSNCSDTAAKRSRKVSLLQFLAFTS